MVKIGRDNLYLVDLLDGEGTRLRIGEDSVKELLAEELEEIGWYFAEVLEKEEDEEIKGAPEIIKVGLPDEAFDTSSNEKISLEVMRPTQFVPSDAIFGSEESENSQS